MALKNLLLKFEDLNKIAKASPSIGRQKELIESYREKNLPFLATLQMRHQLICSECGFPVSAAALHFENPRIKNSTDTSELLFGPTKGIFAQISSEELHKIIEHGDLIPSRLLDVINSVDC